jgi:cephalosporin hydroxylase
MTRSPLWQQTGGIWPLGISCSLTWYDLGAIVYLLQSAHIRLVIEIGVEHGGLAAYLESYGAFTGCVYRGIDIMLGALDSRVRDLIGGAIVARDAWDQQTVEEVRAGMAAIDGPALIICDGGDKPKELKLYAPLIRPGDVLIGHDYHNEYEDAALAGMPPEVMQVRADWLDDTLLCMFVRRP